VNLFAVITKRTVALIVLRVSGTLAGGSIAGVELWQAAMLAAFIGVMDVAESLSRSYVVDGELSVEEINTAFASSAEAELAKTKSSDAQAASVAVTVAEPTYVVSSPVIEQEDDEELEEIDVEEEDEPAKA
jgi:hypothetical protein